MWSKQSFLYPSKRRCQAKRNTNYLFYKKKGLFGHIFCKRMLLDAIIPIQNAIHYKEIPSFLNVSLNLWFNGGTMFNSLEIQNVYVYVPIWVQQRPTYRTSYIHTVPTRPQVNKNKETEIHIMWKLKAQQWRRNPKNRNVGLKVAEIFALLFKKIQDDGTTERNDREKQ